MAEPKPAGSPLWGRLFQAVSELGVGVSLLTALLLDRFGRKPLAIGTMLLSGVFCTAGSLIPGAGTMRSVMLD